MTMRLAIIALVCFLFTTACSTRTAHQSNPLSPAAPGTSINTLSPDSKEAVLTPIGPNAQAGSSGALVTANQERVQSFQVSGKVAVQTSKNSGSANVSWTQRQRQFYMSLNGPMGSHHLVLQGVPGHVILQTGDGKRLQAGSPEELLAKGWGFRLPVSSLRYWIRGVPVPGLPQQTQYDNAHHLIRLVQQGWHIDYLGYTRQGAVDLPQRLSISSPALRAKIVIYQWSI